MIRTFGIGLRSPKGVFGRFDGTFGRKRRQIPGKVLKQGVGKLTVFGRFFGFHGRPYRAKNGVRVLNISQYFLCVFFVFYPRHFHHVFIRENYAYLFISSYLYYKT